jgi:type VI secretion system secreted protein Hcp
MANTFLKFGTNAVTLDQNGVDSQATSDNSCPGESQDANLPTWIEITSWSWGESNPGTWGVGGGGGGSDLGFQDLSFTMPFCKASTMLMGFCATHMPSQYTTVVCRKTGGAAGPYVYLQITLGNVVVSGYQTGGSDNGCMDIFSLNYQTINIQYSTQDSSGNVTAVPAFSYDRSQTSAQQQQ